MLRQGRRKWSSKPGGLPEAGRRKQHPWQKLKLQSGHSWGSACFQVLLNTHERPPPAATAAEPSAVSFLAKGCNSLAVLAPLV